MQVAVKKILPIIEELNLIEDLECAIVPLSVCPGSICNILAIQHRPVISTIADTIPTCINCMFMSSDENQIPHKNHFCDEYLT